MFIGLAMVNVSINWIIIVTARILEHFAMMNCAHPLYTCVINYAKDDMKLINFYGIVQLVCYWFNYTLRDLISHVPHVTNFQLSTSYALCSMDIFFVP